MSYSQSNVFELIRGDPLETSQRGPSILARVRDIDYCDNEMNLTDSRRLN
jgi:hypothetical protein